MTTELANQSRTWSASSDNECLLINADTTESLISEQSFIDPLEKAKLASSNENIGKVFYMSFCFLMLFTATTGEQGLVGEIYEQLGYESLGRINILVMYGIYAIAALFMSGVIKNWNYKSGIFIGSIGYICSLGAGALTTACSMNANHFWCQNSTYAYILNIGGAAINGVCASIMWMSANRYISGCANSENKGKFLGIFGSFVFAPGLVGSLVAAVAIEWFGQFGFFIVMCVITTLASMMMFLAPHVPKYEKQDVQVESVVEKLSKMMKLASSRKMRPFLPYLVFSGFMFAIYNGFEFKVIVQTVPDLSKDKQNSITALVMLVEGGLTIIASFAAGKLADTFKQTTITRTLNIFAALAIVFSYIAYYQESLPFAYLMASLWGISYAGSYTLCSVIVAQDFGGAIEAYAILSFVSNISSALGMTLCIQVANVTAFLCISAGLLLFCEVCLCFYKSDRK